MRYLGLDIGHVRVGVAVSDPTGTVATPVGVLDGKRLATDVRPLADLCAEYEVTTLVVGLPLTMHGEEGPQARSVRERARTCAQALGIPIVFVDERLSSKQATRAMRASGIDARAGRTRVDAVAASLMLQTFLDARRDATDETRE